MKIGNDDDRELEALGLMNRHQTNNVGCLVHLPLTLAAANCFELFDVMHKVANQVARLFKLLGQAKKFFDVADALGAVKTGRGDWHELRGRDSVAKQIGNPVAIAPINHGLDPDGDAIEGRSVVLIDEFNLTGHNGFDGFSQQAGQLRFRYTEGGNTIIYGDVNGDGVADFSIKLLNHQLLHETDILGIDN